MGGRNVGDIYFAFGPDEHYIDTDVLALGPAAADVSAAFDTYWNSASAYPADLTGRSGCKWRHRQRGPQIWLPPI